MKIVYIITRSDVLGGASVHLLDLAKGMISQGHEVHILVGGTGAFTEELEKNDISFSPLNHLKREISLIHDVLGFWEIKKHLKKLKPDIVHCHSSKAGLLGRLAAKSLGLPVVFTAHGWAFTEGISPKKQKIYAQIEKFLIKFSDHIITVSEFDRIYGFNFGVGSLDTVTAVHNGIPVQDLQIEKVRNFDQPCKIIMVARFDDQKDQMTLIQALGILKNKNWFMEFIGSGPTLELCKQVVNQLGLDTKVKFLGQQRNVKGFLNNSDIFVLSTNYEGFPLTILEAMRAKLPVIATNVGGNNESVIDNETGFLTRKNDIQDLSKSLSILIDDRNLAIEMGKRGYERFITEFTHDLMLKKILKIYTKIVAIK
ncbi:glycosyltransferase family 4 protein [Acinetobacter sp. NS4_7]